MKLKIPSLLDLDIPQSEWDDPALDLQNTGRRVAAMYRDELLAGYRPGALEKLIASFTTFPNKSRQAAMVAEMDINFESLCSHHCLPFMGVAHVAYIPGNKLVGASKLPRVIDHFSHMLQIQERLVDQVANFIYTYAEAKFVVVMMEATHMCMSIRGVSKPNVKMITTCVCPPIEADNETFIRGVLDEFYSQVRRGK
jgi:GTP cyclohydrolase I